MMESRRQINPWGVLALLALVVGGVALAMHQPQNPVAVSVQSAVGSATPEATAIARNELPRYLSDEYFNRTPGRKAAPPDRQRFAERAVLAQLKSLRSGSYDALAIAQGRFTGITITDPRIYYNYARNQCTPFKAWKKLTYLKSFVFPGDKDGVFILIRLKEPYDTPSTLPAIFLFYCNSSYTVSNSDA